MVGVVCEKVFLGVVSKAGQSEQTRHKHRKKARSLIFFRPGDRPGRALSFGWPRTLWLRKSHQSSARHQQDQQPSTEYHSSGEGARGWDDSWPVVWGIILPDQELYRFNLRAMPCCHATIDAATQSVIGMIEARQTLSEASFRATGDYRSVGLVLPGRSFSSKSRSA